MSRPLYIFDLDGTLALIEHRRHFVERPRDEQDWESFYSECVNDTRNEPLTDILHALLCGGNDVWVFSGRSKVVEEETHQWLADNTAFFELMKPENIMMREIGDFTPDDVLKKQWLDAMLPEDRARLLAVFDDRDRVVNMWRDNGITCLQVAPGSF